MNATAEKKHQDGGTYVVLQLASTRDGWGIAITRWTTYRNAVRFEVMRVSDENKMLRLNYFDSERKARAFANEMWKQDR